MPCNQIRTTSIELNLANQELLIKALKELYGQGGVEVLGNTIYIRSGSENFTVSAGKVTLRYSAGYMSSQQADKQAGEIANKIKRGYTAEAIKFGAKKMGWNIKSTGNTQHIQATRRTL